MQLVPVSHMPGPATRPGVAPITWNRLIEIRPVLGCGPVSAWQGGVSYLPHLAQQCSSDKQQYKQPVSTQHSIVTPHAPLLSSTWRVGESTALAIHSLFTTPYPSPRHTHLAGELVHVAELIVLGVSLLPAQELGHTPHVPCTISLGRHFSPKLWALPTHTQADGPPSILGLKITENGAPTGWQR